MWSGDGEKGEAYSGVLAQALLEEMFCWDDIPPKRGKEELESLGKREYSAFIQMGMPWKARK